MGLFFARGHAWLLQGVVHGFCWGACMVFARGHAWFLPGGHAWFFLGGHAWFFLGGGMHRIRRDTVNERAVRILLECILVHLFNVICKQHHRNAFNPHFNAKKKGDFDGKCV